MTEFPEVGEIVICKITKILNYGVFAELLEYEGVQGFVHISQVSSSWIKNIRNFVKENQIRAAEVSNIDRQKNQIDLSFNKVSESAQRSRIEEYRQKKRSQKLLEIVANDTKSDFDSVWAEIAEPLLSKYDSLYEAFQEILLKREEAVSLVPAKWARPLLAVIEKNVEIPEKVVKGMLTLTSMDPNGVLLIKKALADAENSNPSKDAEVEISYAGSGKYILKATATNYKAAEKALKAVSEKAVESIEKASGSGSFERAT